MAPVKKTAAKTTKADSASVKETAAALAAEDAKKAEAPKAAAAKKPAAAKKTTATAKKTTTAAVKKAPAKKTTTAARTKKEVKHTSIVEFGGNQYDVAEIQARAEAAFKDANKRKRYDEFRIYIKPEENKAFYVVKSGDKESTGSIDL